MKRVLITTIPFGEKKPLPLELLKEAGVSFEINPLGKKLTENELAGMVADYDAIIAGTEPITDRVMSRAPKLKFISRVGIGLDSVDLCAARNRNILVAYTPDAPAKAVSELTIGLMLSLLRGFHLANTQMHQGKWERIFGRRLGEVTVGLIGLGRVGTGVLSRLQGFGCPRILVNDIDPKRHLETAFGFEWVDKKTIYKEADVISLHVPLTKQTRGMIQKPELKMMKPDAVLINTARGGVVREGDLYDILRAGYLGGAAVDVFEQEPYSGPLCEVASCLLTSHMGSMSVDCRSRMEIEATEEVIRFLSGKSLENLVPEEEYEARQ
jgi:D-3-phosphoglycerate dehydrogenase / 2-oxoglutarate reductase